MSDGKRQGGRTKRALQKIVQGVRGTADGELRELRRILEESRLLTAKLLVHQLCAGGPLPRLRDAEFKVFSQFGDDGIVQYL